MSVYDQVSTAKMRTGSKESPVTVRAYYTEGSSADGFRLPSGDALIDVNYPYDPFDEYDSFSLEEDIALPLTITGEASTTGVVISTDFTVLWETKRLFVQDATFMWDTAQATMIWYRVVGITREICKPSECECVQVITNIHATSLGNLCEKLNLRGWNWPIKTVERWSDDHCTLELVEICDHPLCGEFCLGEDVNVSMGFDMQLTMLGYYFYTMSEDGLGVSGEADVVWSDGFLERHWDSSGLSKWGAGVRNYGTAICENSARWASGGANVSSNADMSFSRWSFIGGEWPNFQQSIAQNASIMAWTEAGEVDWQDIDRISYSDSQSASVNISYGKYSNFIVARNFGLQIPEYSRILGIEIIVNRVATMSVKDMEVCLVLGSNRVSDNLAKSYYWPYIYTETSYGGISNDWRNLTRETYGDWTGNDLNRSDFGVAIRVASMGAIADTYARIDSVSINVCYEKAYEPQVISVYGNCYWTAKDSYYTAIGTMNISGNAIENVQYTHVYESSTNPIMMGGTYIRGFHYSTMAYFLYDMETCETILLGGKWASGPELLSTTFCKPSWQHIEGSGGARLKGAGCLENWWSSDGDGLEIGGNGILRRVGCRYIPEDSQIIVEPPGIEFSDEFTGEFLQGQELFLPIVTYKYLTDGIGASTAGGYADVISSAMRWRSRGRLIFISGSAETNHRGFGTFTIVSAYGDMQIRNMSATLGDVGTPLDMPLLTGIVRECGCSVIPLSINLKHNFDVNNKLTQFLLRTKQALPSVVPMVYNSVNNMWQANYHLSGWSVEHPDGIETWNILFDLSCTEEIGSVETDQPLWCFTAQITQRESVGTHRLTKVMVAVAPTNICKRNSLHYSFTYNTVLNSVTVDPNSVLYQKLIYDNIGLFKNQLWNNNPLLEISISQAILPRYIRETLVTSVLGEPPTTPPIMRT